uniref:Putative conserved secreted protein n=1 Tax=Amblyomma tuberculatum TaxID=48802 RepID=A0A6M2E3U5_9ACAR
MKTVVLTVTALLLPAVMLAKSQALLEQEAYSGGSAFPGRTFGSGYPGNQFPGPIGSPHSGSRRCGRNFCPPGRRCVQVPVRCVAPPCPTIDA